MELTLVGLNHKTAPIALREEIAFAEAALPCALQTLRSEFGFGEAMIVSTCNRVEILVDNSKNGASGDQIEAFLSHYHGVNPVRFAPHLYTFRNDELVRHVFRVASSLDSMVPGEAQILGQIKQAYAIAQDAGTIGKLLTRLIPHAFYVAKRVRRETQVGTSSVSVSSVAVGGRTAGCGVQAGILTAQARRKKSIQCRIALHLRAIHILPPSEYQKEMTVRRRVGRHYAYAALSWDT